jgi:hypothetical protein
MDEDIEMATGAGAGIVQQARALGSETIDGGGEIRDFESDVMEAFAAFLDELCNHGIGFGGFEQFDARSSGGKHCDSHFFLFYGFALGDRESELVFVELEGGVQRPDGDA